MAAQGFYRRNVNNKAESSVKPRYEMRASQLFGPYGVGSIYPCHDGQSVMIAGLDANLHFEEDATEIKDSRLARHIGVKRLLSPNGVDCIPAVTFPCWTYCSSCGSMIKFKYADRFYRKCPKKDCKGRLVPERFIVVCPEGHIDDFPLLQWVHRGEPLGEASHELRRVTMGGSLALGDVVYLCSCGMKRSLTDAARIGALEEVGYSCKGTKPWLMQPCDVKQGCSNSGPLQVVQRGGSNVWYADIASSIYIPDGRDPAVVEKVNSVFEKLEKANNDGMLDMAIDLVAASVNMKADLLKQAFLERLGSGDEDCLTEAEFRWQEFCTLKNAAVKQKGIFSGRVVAGSEYRKSEMNCVVEGITLVSMLRETRALVGFSRLVPDKNEELSYAKRRRSLSRDELDWTIAMQSTGEGIFLSFNKAAVSEWQNRTETQRRIAIMQRNFNVQQQQRGKEECKVINPAFLFIHALSHALILSLSEVCGYSPSSLRERVYCDKYIIDDDRHEDMLGLLIFTATGDSEGSLGGLVRAGSPGRFEDIFDSAIEAMRWCSMDPVCIDSKGQGPDSCNLAACYNCLLIPETACEMGNKFLDRALLVGTLDQSGVGIFCAPDTRKVLYLEADFESCTETTGWSFVTACESARCLNAE